MAQDHIVHLPVQLNKLHIVVTETKSYGLTDACLGKEVNRLAQK